MDWIAVLLFPILALVTLLRLLSPKNSGRRLMVAFTTFGIPFLIFFLDEILGQIYLRAMCNLYGGYSVTEPIRTEGYYSTYRSSVHEGCALDCQVALLDRKFQYFETDVQYQYPYYTNQKGVHRFFLADAGSGQCSTEGQHRKGGDWATIPPDKCIAYTRSTEPTSRYEVKLASGDFWSKDDKIGIPPFKLQKHYSYVKDRVSGNLVGSFTTYWYWGGWIQSQRSATSCPGYSLSHSSIFERIILPKMPANPTVEGTPREDAARRPSLPR